MKILVAIRHSPVKYYLMSVNDLPAIDEIVGLLCQREHSRAITTVFSRGYFEREVSAREVPLVKTDAILTEESVHWDLMNK